MTERELLKIAKAAIYSTLCESNGISDNEWMTTEGVVKPEFPISSFVSSLRRLDKVYTSISEYLDPDEAVKDRKWRDACATASAIVERHKTYGEQEGSLHRNIADAINGNLRLTSEERAAGTKLHGTMSDHLNGLVSAGKLFKYPPDQG